MSIKIIIGFVTALAAVQASHYRGGTISFRPMNSESTTFPMHFVVQYRVAWRMAGYRFNCDQQAVNESKMLTGEGTMYPIRRQEQGSISMSPPSKRLNYICTDYDVGENWSAGEMSINMTVMNNNTREIDLGYRGCCWVYRINGGTGSWRVYTTMNLIPRSDNGLINSSPQTTTTPLIKVMKGCSQVFELPSTDPDGDVTRCRFAVEEECGGRCSDMGDYAIISDSKRCEIIFNATSLRTGLYRVSLRVEDFMDDSSTTALSSIPLQFLVQVFELRLNSGEKNITCEDMPQFSEPTPAKGTCVGVMKGENMGMKVAALPSLAGDSIGRFITASPRGLTRGPITVDANNVSSAMIEWTPTREQEGKQHLFCVTAQSGRGLPSEQRCMVLNVISSKPKLSTLQPTSSSNVDASRKTWTIVFDTEVMKPEHEASVNFYETSGELILSVDCASADVNYSGNQMNINTPDIDLKEGVEYTIALDYGVAMGMDGCGSYSDSLAQDVWTFTVNSCADRGEGAMFEDSEKCEGYYQCVHGKPLKRQCPRGTRFHSEKKMCMHKDVFKNPCKNKDEEEHNDEERKGAKKCNNHLMHGQMIPHPDDCTKYIVCSSGRGFEKKCAAGLYYHDDIKTCNWGAPAGCE